MSTSTVPTVPPHPAVASDAAYRLRDCAADVLTPALAIYPEIVDANISATLRLLGGDPGRWRPHVKTAKLGAVMRRLVERGVTHVKCATTLELATACEAGTTDALLAYAVAAPHARRVRELALRHPGVRISVLVEDAAQLGAWRGAPVAVFVDVNPGMDRTGIGQERTDDILALARAIGDAGLAFAGLHYYDGHLAGLPLPEREAAAHRGYDRLMQIAAALAAAGIPVPEVVTAGTPA